MVIFACAIPERWYHSRNSQKLPFHYKQYNARIVLNDTVSRYEPLVFATDFIFYIGNLNISGITSLYVPGSHGLNVETLPRVPQYSRIERERFPIIFVVWE